MRGKRSVDYDHAAVYCFSSASTFYGVKKPNLGGKPVILQSTFISPNLLQTPFVLKRRAVLPVPGTSSPLCILSHHCIYGPP